MTTNGTKQFLAQVASKLIAPAVIGLIILWGSNLTQGQQIAQLTELTKEIKVKVETISTWATAHQAVHEERDRDAGWSSRDTLRQRTPYQRSARRVERDNSTKTGG